MTHLFIIAIEFYHLAQTILRLLNFHPLILLFRGLYVAHWFILLTNLAVIAVDSITLQLLSVQHYLQGSELNLTSLLIFFAVFCFAGSLISLLISKWMAKRSAGVKIITKAATDDERWLVATIRELAAKAGIGMPEVGIFPAPESNAFATG